MYHHPVITNITEVISVVFILKEVLSVNLFMCFSNKQTKKGKKKLCLLEHTYVGSYTECEYVGLCYLSRW